MTRRAVRVSADAFRAEAAALLEAMAGSDAGQAIVAAYRWGAAQVNAERGAAGERRRRR